MKKYLSFAITAFLFVGLAGCNDKNMEVPELMEPVDVKRDTAEVKRGEISKVTTYSGEVVPYVEELYFSEGGCLDGIYVAVGDMVQQGQLLASIDQGEVLERAETLEKEISEIVRQGEYSDRQADADIRIAREELAILQESEAGAQTCEAKELEIRQLERKLAQTRELRDLELQEKRTELETLLERRELTAPFSGTVVYISDIDEGDEIQEKEPMIYLADDSRLSLLTDYISEEIIKAADQISARVLDKEYDISYVPYDRNEYIAMALSGEEMKSDFSFTAPDSSLESGQFAVILVTTLYKEEVLTIPVNALYRDGTGRYVYRQEEDQMVRCDVTVGITTDTKAEIVEGLQEGDMVYVKD